MGGKARTRWSRDGSWTKKGSRSIYAYKLHSKTDVDYGLIRDLETTPANVRQQGGPVPKGRGGVSGQGVLRGASWVRCDDEACCAGSSAGHTGQVEEPAYQPEEGAGGTGYRLDQAGVRSWACAGDDGGAGSREDGVRVFLLQPVSAGHIGGEVVAWALDVSRERNEGWWGTG